MEPTGHSAKSRYDPKKMRRHGKKSTGRKRMNHGDESSSSTSSESSEDTEQLTSQISGTPASYHMYSEVNFMLPESMPSKNDATFLSHLQVMTPDPLSLGLKSNKEDRPVHLMWAPTIQYSSPYKEFPACVYITTESIHIFSVKALTSDFEIPEMSHLYCIPLMNVQQIVLGYKNLYIRIEEAFVGPNGTFTFLTCNAGKTDLFLDSLKLAYRRAVPDFDQYEDPHVVVNESTEMNLKKVLAFVEQVPVEGIDIVAYMLVNMCDESTLQKSYTCHTLVITSRYLFILREDYIFWPQPTFSIGASTRPQFEVVTAIPIKSRIASFQMYDSDTCNPGQNQSLASTFLATNTSAMLTPHFIGYGVKLVFDLGGASGTTKELDIRVSTPNARNKFQEALTMAREKFAKHSPLKVRFKLKDSDSSGSTGSGSKVTKGQKKVRSKTRNVKSNENLTNTSNTALTSDQTKPEEQVEENSIQSQDYIARSDISRGSPTGETSKTEKSVEESYFKSVPQEILHETELDLSSVNVDQLQMSYPSIDLLRQLTESNENVRILKPLSDKMQNLANMTGEEILNYFHSNLSQIRKDGEELCHVLWTDVVPYINTKQIITTCIMLSNKAVFFVSDDEPRQSVLQKQTWRKHVRYRSDITQIRPGSRDQHDNGKVHHTSGILQNTNLKQGQTPLKPFYILPLKELHSVNIGLFNQSFRLSGKEAESVYCCLTKDAKVTEEFTRKLMDILVLMEIPPAPVTVELTTSASQQDFYNMFRRSPHNFKRSISGSHQFIHESGVKFVYPSDDIVSDLIYVIKENMKGLKPSSINILSYTLCYKSKENTNQLPNLPLEDCKYDPRTVVLTETHIALVAEDYVSYPLPEFAKQPPLHSQHTVLEVRNLKHLKKITKNSLNPNGLILTFSDESDEVCVNVAFEYYNPSSGAVPKHEIQAPEVTWVLAIENIKDKERFWNFVTSRCNELPNPSLIVQSC